MHEQLLGRAAWHSPTVVMGLLMRPYSIGHDLRLTYLGNTLANSDYASPAELSEAALICHQSWRECERMPWDPLIRLKLWLWRRRCRQLVHKSEVAKFVHYRDSGNLEFPPSGITRPGSTSEPRIAGAPLLLRLQQWLMITLHLTEDQAWDYPLGLAKCRWGAYWEENGDWSIYNEAEAEFDRFVAEQEAKRKAQE